MQSLKSIIDEECPPGTAKLCRHIELSAAVEEIYFTSLTKWVPQSDLFREWPGPESNVFRWFVLENGVALGLTGSVEEPHGATRMPFKKTYRLDWNRLRNCHIVHRAGSFTKASQVMGITQSAVSRQIGALERELGYDIFFRNREGLLPTEYGEYFLDSIKQMSDVLELGLARLNELHEAPTGPITLTTTETFGAAWLSPRLPKFHEMHPDIEVSLKLSDTLSLDLCQREADCAIRFQKPEQPNLVFLQVETFSYHIYGSREYLAKHSEPKCMEDLADHQLIVYGQGVGEPPVEGLNWLQELASNGEPKKHPDISINNIYGIYRAAENGLGLAALPYYISERSDQLKIVLPEISGPRIPIFFVYPQELGQSRRISLLRNFIVSEIRTSWTALKENGLI